MKLGALLAIAAIASSPVLAIPAMAKPMAPSAFVAHAIRGDIGEIELGQLAEKQGGSEGVKAFGKTLVADHTAARNEMSKVATDMHIKVPSTPTADARRTYQRLSKLNGARFDREFVRHMVADHRKDIKDFKNFSSKGSGEAQSTAQKELPVLQKHLDMAQQLAGKGKGNQNASM